MCAGGFNRGLNTGGSSGGSEEVTGATAKLNTCLLWERFLRCHPIKPQECSTNGIDIHTVPTLLHHCGSLPCLC
eukprot:2868950-Amphidinium_carterae.5